MSTTSTEGRRRPGAQRRPATTARGEAILAEIDKQGLTLHEAAARAGISFESLSRVIHETEPGRLKVSTVAAVCGRLGIPLELAAPDLAAFSQTASVD